MTEPEQAGRANQVGGEEFDLVAAIEAMSDYELSEWARATAYDHLAERVATLENALETLRNELKTHRARTTHQATNAALTRIAHLGVGH